MTESESLRRSSPEGNCGKSSMLLLICSSGFALAMAAFFFLMHPAHAEIPPDTRKDLQTAHRVKHSRHHFERFLDLRYGSQTNPSNRMKALEGFFDADNIEALYLMVNGRTNARMHAHIARVAHTIAKYRETMSPKETVQLGAYFRSDAGRAQVRKATDFYESKDPSFRSMTAPVIKQLLITVTVTEQAQTPQSP